MVGNKNDLFEDMEITEEEMEKKAGELNIKLKMIVRLMILKDLKDFWMNYYKNILINIIRKKLLKIKKNKKKEKINVIFCN